MARQLYLAANLVSQTLIYGHLQIVYADAKGNLLEAECTSSGFPYFLGDWTYPDFGRRHDLPDHTPHYGDPNAYAVVEMNLRSEQEAETVWELVGQIHASLIGGDHGLNYDIEQNSNSYATSLLSVVGIDISDYDPAVETSEIRGFPGIETNIFDGAKTGGLFSGDNTAVPLTLAGTMGNDYIVTGIGDDNLRGASGRDEIHAGRGADLVRGASRPTYFSAKPAMTGFMATPMRTASSADRAWTASMAAGAGTRSMETMATICSWAIGEKMTYQAAPARTGSMAALATTF